MIRTKSDAPARLAALLLAVLVPGAARAGLEPHGLFRDRAVLQRGVKVPVWGTTDRDGAVTVSIAGLQASAKPEGGKWRVELEPLAAGGPHAMTISQGDQKVELADILVGEVWLAGGQSNMQWPLNRTAGGEAAIAASANPRIRLFTVPRRGAPAPESNVKGEWKACGPESSAEFSAVAYYFGRDLEKALGVPIGLVSSNLGGTAAERWMKKEAIEGNPDLAGITSPQGASDLWNAMIAPLAPFAIRGAIWYQGESNSERAFQYRKLFPAMIRSWRDTFGQGDFPFLFVQLAPFMRIAPEPEESAWAELREAQLLAARTVPKTAMVVITDAGDEKDIHPGKKEPVGARLALAARAVAYGEKVEHSGPVLEKMAVEGSQAVLSFTHAGGGLVARDGEPRGFTVAGDDRKFHPASARIEGDRVIVRCEKVEKPVAVRYGWANYPVGNLWNQAGLPASPFRTDTFPGVTDEKK
jgi:sialate O-acetylesterase